MLGRAPPMTDHTHNTTQHRSAQKLTTPSRCRSSSRPTHQPPRWHHPYAPATCTTATPCPAAGVATCGISRTIEQTADEEARVGGMHVADGCGASKHQQQRAFGRASGALLAECARKKPLNSFLLISRACVLCHLLKGERSLLIAVGFVKLSVQHECAELRAQFLVPAELCTGRCTGRGGGGCESEVNIRRGVQREA